MEWRKVKIADVAQRFISGGTPSRGIDEYWGGSIPWITGADFDGIVNHFLKQRSCRQESDECITKLFTVLLHHAFSGDLTAKWREAHMKELLKEMELQAKKLRKEDA